jgi:nucleoside-diphosphate-sugar epimerase
MSKILIVGGAGFIGSQEMNKNANSFRSSKIIPRLVIFAHRKN